MQSKISSFFKPPSTLSSSATEPTREHLSGNGGDELDVWEKTKHKFVNTYQRRGPKPEQGAKGSEDNEIAKPISKETPSRPEPRNSGKVLNKKRSYAQFYLDLGQSDFNLRTCSTCGFKYAPGEEGDEKEHKIFHKDYVQGIPFRVSVNERFVCVSCNDGGRIVLVPDCDPPTALRNKVHEVIKMMEIGLGSGWIFHKLCKVYLFISSQRVAGCLVTEPIKEAFKVLSSPADIRSPGATAKDSRSNSTTLQFGEIVMRRETTKRISSVHSSGEFDREQNGAIVCEDKAIPAICGVRAIWTTPSNRRKRIASQLLDAARSFCVDFPLEKSQLAFSPPTAAGKALASSYFSTASFLVYKSKPGGNEFIMSPTFHLTETV